MSFLFCFRVGFVSLLLFCLGVWVVRLVRHSRVLCFWGCFWLFFVGFGLGCWFVVGFFSGFLLFSTRRCFGLFSMVLGCLFLVGLRFGVGWCKFISCCSARLVLLG